jgi:competence protein ComFC
MDKHIVDEMTQPGPAQDLATPGHSVAHALSLLAKKVFDFVFPEEEGCVLCGKAADSRHSEEVFFALICGNCLSRIPFVQEPICEVCGRPLRGPPANTKGRGYRGRQQAADTTVAGRKSLGRQKPANTVVARRGHRGHVRGQQADMGGCCRLKTQASLIPGVARDTSPGMHQLEDKGAQTNGSEVKSRAVCSDCRRQGRFFQRARAFGTYDGALMELIREFKFYGRRDLAEGLGVLMAREVSRDIRMRRCDIIVPVPLHPIRLAERGYNQAELLAKEVGFCFGIRVQDSVERLIGPGEQNKLGRQLRRDHMRGAFNVPYPIRIAGKRVLLADDVITTGNTANECARALLRAGAAEVYVIAAAISPFEQEWLVH